MEDIPNNAERQQPAVMLKEVVKQPVTEAEHIAFIAKAEELLAKSEQALGYEDNMTFQELLARSRTEFLKSLSFYHGDDKDKISEQLAIVKDIHERFWPKLGPSPLGSDKDGKNVGGLDVYNSIIRVYNKCRGVLIDYRIRDSEIEAQKKLAVKANIKFLLPTAAQGLYPIFSAFYDSASSVKASGFPQVVPMKDDLSKLLDIRKDPPKELQVPGPVTGDNPPQTGTYEKVVAHDAMMTNAEEEPPMVKTEEDLIQERAAEEREKEYQLELEAEKTRVHKLAAGNNVIIDSNTLRIFMNDCDIAYVFDDGVLVAMDVYTGGLTDSQKKMKWVDLMNYKNEIVLVQMCRESVKKMDLEKKEEWLAIKKAAAEKKRAEDEAYAAIVPPSASEGEVVAQQTQTTSMNTNADNGSPNVNTIDNDPPVTIINTTSTRKKVNVRRSSRNK